MRVIAGKYKKRQLKVPKTQLTRPTTDKNKENLFNMIGPYFEGGTVLDLFGGSGGLGIEAISRGCDTLYSVDKQYEAFKTIKENFALLQLENCYPLKMDYKKDLNYLKEKGIIENPTLKVLNIEGKELLSTENFGKSSNSIMTLPIELGYENKHQLLATFELPFVFRALSGILWVELIFMIGFIFCLVWQWCSIRMTVRSARIQTMGMTHLEHELKKPLATMISVVNGILEGKDSVLCPRDTTKLTMVKARLMKMADITDTMLTSLKTSVLMINREVIDLKFEMEMTTEMFSLIRPYARVGYRIAEGLEYPCLDKIYFNYVVVNLVDNAIKYGGTHPVVKVDFYTIGDNYVLTVEDNGMGIAPKDQKQIFKQFYRVKNQQVTKTTGFGLGLTFVHKVVCAYGGSIRLESELGIGSKFTITIPQ